MKRKLKESWSSIQGGRVDVKAGVVKGVKVVGFTSTHGYRYSPEALKNAVPLYEGAKVNIDHPTRADVERRSRSYADRFGRLQNARFVDGKGIYADFHFNRSHRLAKQFIEDVRRDPKNLGFSQYAHGRTRRRGNEEVVEVIESVSSVDLVADPATTSSLFESEKTVRRRPRVRKQAKWEKLMESLGMELGETPTPREAIAKLMESIMLDGSLSAKQRREKIMKALEMDVEESSKSTRVEEAENTMKKKPIVKKASRELIEAKRELAKAQKALNDRKHSDRVRALCESMEFQPSNLQLKAVAAMGSKREAKKLIESFQADQRRDRKKQTSNKPKSRQNESVGSKRLSEAEVDAWLDDLVE